MVSLFAMSCGGIRFADLRCAEFWFDEFNCSKFRKEGEEEA